jgi:hypothetical protein
MSSELNKLSIAYKQLQAFLNENRKYTIEVIGEQTDCYQNILPLCIDATFLHEQRNQYNQSDKTEYSDAYLIDGTGAKYTKANYTIYPIYDPESLSTILEYKCVHTPYVDVTTFSSYLESKGRVFF